MHMLSRYALLYLFFVLCVLAQTPTSPGNDLSTGAVVAIAITGSAVLAVGVILLLLLCLKRAKRQKAFNSVSPSFKRKNSDQRSSFQTVEEATAGGPTTFQPHPKQGDVSRVEDASNQDSPTLLQTQQGENQSNVSMPIQHILSKSGHKRHSLISKNEIAIEKEIGEGSYGKVYFGRWHGSPVALKYCKKKGKLDDFVKELNLMTKLPPHPNVVRLFGVSLDGSEPAIVLEYCAGGSLDALLYESNKTLSDEFKMNLIREIAAGMLHLHRYNIVHRDLAARNVLLTETGHAKISDFGMSRLLVRTDIAKTEANIGPIRWMAPESLGQQIYSKYSDVWSFGIVIYEIVAQREPHTEINPLDVGALIRDKFLTPRIPNGCPQKLQTLMTMCWNPQPEQRPDRKSVV